MTDDLVVSLVGKDVKDVVKEGEIRWIYLLFEWFERRDASRKLWIIFCYIEIVPHHWWFIWISRLTVFRWYFISFICTKVSFLNYSSCYLYFSSIEKCNSYDQRILYRSFRENLRIFFNHLFKRFVKPFDYTLFAGEYWLSQPRFGLFIQVFFDNF